MKELTRREKSFLKTNSSTSSQNKPINLWKANVRYHMPEMPPLVSKMNQFMHTHTIT